MLSGRSFVVATTVLVCSLCGASVASADLVFLTSGRSLSVKTVAFDGDQATLTLRAGGEVTCERALIDRIEPDEVPYPEPVPEATAAVAPLGARSAALDATTITPPRPIPSEYSALVTELSKRHGVDAQLVNAVITVESAYEPRARSPKGARGLMQLMPATARQYGVRNSYNPAANLDAGIKHLKSLLDRFELSLALAAYNAGEATVRRFGGIPPYRETQDYVARVLRLAGRQ
jgi:membrane-bound lytic murein transglycosylase B